MDEGSFVGVLTFSDAAEYISMCRPDGEAEIIKRDGICVMKLSDAEQVALGELNQSLCAVLNTMSLDNLKHNTNKHGVLSSNHPERKWRRMAPKENAVEMTPREKKVQLHVDNFLLPLMGKRLLPHETYARLAAITWIKLREEVNVYESDEFSHVLGFGHVNGLARGPNLSEDQVLHIDGTGMKIATILVAMCGDNGYDVRCVKGSHNCLEKTRPRYMDS